MSPTARLPHHLETVTFNSDYRALGGPSSWRTSSLSVVVEHRPCVAGGCGAKAAAPETRNLRLVKRRLPAVFRAEGRVTYLIRLSVNPYRRRLAGCSGGLSWSASSCWHSAASLARLHI